MNYNTIQVISIVIMIISSSMFILYVLQKEQTMVYIFSGVIISGLIMFFIAGKLEELQFNEEVEH